MKKRTATDDIMKTLFTAEEAKEVHKEAEKIIIKWGGKRENAGRKPKSTSNVLKFSVKVSEKEKEFLKYARSHNINYDDLMQG